MNGVWKSVYKYHRLFLLHYLLNSDAIRVGMLHEMFLDT